MGHAPCAGSAILQHSLRPGQGAGGRYICSTAPGVGREATHSLPTPTTAPPSRRYCGTPSSPSNFKSSPLVYPPRDSAYTEMVDMPLNDPMTKEALAHTRVLPSHVAYGPAVVEFRVKSSPQENTDGVPMKQLLNSRGVSSLLRDAGEQSIRAFSDGRVDVVHIVIWGPDRPNGYWGHHVRTIPAAALRNKGDLAIAVALEYNAFCDECSRRPKAPSHTTQYKPLDFNEISLVALKKLSGNVYQVELKATHAASQPVSRRW